MRSPIVVIADPIANDPASSSHAFAIASPHCIAPRFLAEITAVLRHEAPSIALAIRALGADFVFEGAVARAEVGIVLGS